jgi:hypothetical protein
MLTLPAPACSSLMTGSSFWISSTTPWGLRIGSLSDTLRVSGLARGKRLFSWPKLPAMPLSVFISMALSLSIFRNRLSISFSRKDVFLFTLRSCLRPSRPCSADALDELSAVNPFPSAIFAVVSESEPIDERGGVYVPLAIKLELLTCFLAELLAG